MIYLKFQQLQINIDSYTANNITCEDIENKNTSTLSHPSMQFNSGNFGIIPTIKANFIEVAIFLASVT